ncbi:MAG: Na+/H+ antiporter NhaC [Bacteroidales bacterium]|nr:Na+/H+ antiporter NhaC [Bacteroidales bacterium]
MSNSKKPTLIISFIPVFFLLVFLTANVLIFDDTLEGSNQIILLLTGSLTALLAFRYKVKWNSVSDSIIKNIGKAMPAMLILLLIGSLAGTWLLSGVVPALIYYGLKISNPKIFLFTAVIVSGVVSLATGSSWSTIATIGVALLGIGKTLGIHEGIVAGAIISGSYFGDKMSPLSDTTNLAPAVAGTDLFTHIRYMVITTGPSILIATLMFFVAGFIYDFDQTQSSIDDVLSAIENRFYISPVLLIIPVILIIIIIKKVPPLPALMSGTLLGGLFAVIFQPAVVRSISGIDAIYLIQGYKAFMHSMFGTVNIASENEIVSELFNTTGMGGMLNTVWLILSAMVFGGTMEAAGFLSCITRSIMNRVKSTGSLIMSTIFTSIFFNVTASDQYISIVVPGRMYAKTYRDRGLKPEVLSRTLEDGGTITSVLVPWNTCGATQSKVLGVSTWTYLPYCFFNLINPLVAIGIGYANYKIRRTEEVEGQEEILFGGKSA